MHTKDVGNFYDLCRKNEKIGNEVMDAARNYDMDKTESNLKRILEKIISIAQKNGYDIKASDILEYVKESKKNLSAEELKMVSGGASKALSTMVAAVTLFSSVVPNRRAFASDIGTENFVPDVFIGSFDSGPSLSVPNEEEVEEGEEGEEDEENEEVRRVVDAMSSLGMAKKSKRSYVPEVFRLLSSEEIDEGTDIASLLKMKIVGNMELFTTFLRMNDASKNKDFIFNVTGGNLEEEFDQSLFGTFFETFFGTFFSSSLGDLVSSEGIMLFSRIYDVKGSEEDEGFKDLVTQYLETVLDSGNRFILLELIKKFPGILEDVEADLVARIIEFLAGRVMNKASWLVNNPAFFKFFIENDGETAMCAVVNILKTNALERDCQMYPNLINVIDPVLTNVISEWTDEELLDKAMKCPVLLGYIITKREDLAHSAILKALTENGSRAFENFVSKNRDFFEIVCTILNDAFSGDVSLEGNLLGWAKNSSTFLEYVIENKSEDCVTEIVKKLGEDDATFLEKNIEKNENLAEKITPVIIKIFDGCGEDLQQLLINSPLLLGYMVDIKGTEFASDVIGKILEGESAEEFKNVLFGNYKIFEKLFPLMNEKEILPEGIFEEFFTKNKTNFMKCAEDIPDIFSALLELNKGLADGCIASLLENGRLKNWIIENPDLLGVLYGAYGEEISETLEEIFKGSGFVKWVMGNPILLETLNKISRDCLTETIEKIRITPNWFSWLYGDSDIIKLLLHLGTQECIDLTDDFFKRLLSNVSKTQDWICENPDMFAVLKDGCFFTELMVAIDSMDESRLITLLRSSPEASEFGRLNCKSMVARMIKKLPETDLERWVYSDPNILFKLEADGGIESEKVIEKLVEEAHDFGWIMENYNLYISLIYIRPEILDYLNEEDTVEVVRSLLDNVNPKCEGEISAWLHENHRLTAVLVRAKADYIIEYIRSFLRETEFMEFITIHQGLFCELMRSGLAGEVTAGFWEYITSDGGILKIWMQDSPDSLAAFIKNLEGDQVNELIDLIRENLDEDENFDEFICKNPQVFIALDEKDAENLGEFLQYLLENDEQLKGFLFDSPGIFHLLLSKGFSAHIEKFFDLLGDEGRREWIWNNPGVFSELQSNCEAYIDDFIASIIAEGKIKDWAYRNTELFAEVLKNCAEGTVDNFLRGDCKFDLKEVKRLGTYYDRSIFSALADREDGRDILGQIIQLMDVDDFVDLLLSCNLRYNWEWMVTNYLENVNAAFEDMRESGYIFKYIDENLDILPLLAVINEEIAIECMGYIGQKYGLSQEYEIIEIRDTVANAIKMCESRGVVGNESLWEFCRQRAKTMVRR